MTNRDRGVVAALSALLVVLVIVAAAPSTGPGDGIGAGPAGSGDGSAPSADLPKVYREGMIGRPSSINPLTARTQADRNLAALIFSGLVALGPDGTYRPDLAASWSVDPKGRRWTFRIRPDARWQDGEPVTAADVVFTVAVLKDPQYTGPLGASWKEITATAVDEQTVRFDLATPLGGFLQAATIGLLPEHLLRDTPIETLADDPFSLQPVGSGPFVLTTWNAESANLVPVDLADVPIVEPSADASAAGPVIGSAAPDPSQEAAASAGSIDPGTTATGSPGASLPPVEDASPETSGSPDASAEPGASASAEPSLVPGPGLPGIQFSFYPDAGALAAAYRAGDLDAATGLPPETARELGALPGSRLLTYPRTTLSGLALNLRPGNGELRVPQVRHGLLAAIDRTAIIADVFGGAATRADSPIPPASWAYDPKAARQVRYNPKRTAADLKAAGWRRLAKGWAAPGNKRAYLLELLAPDAATNPTTMALAEAVARDWRDAGLQVKVVGLAPAKFVERLQKGDFKAAAIDVALGLDPDLYPLFASTQVVSGGSNVTGIQDVALDRDLVAARSPGSLADRKAAFSRLQARLSDRNYLLPMAFRNDLVVVADRVLGPVERELGDPSDRFWDVLTWRLADGG